MARGFFVAVGIFVVLLGLECLVIDRVFLRDDPVPSTAAMSGQPQEQPLSAAFAFRNPMQKNSPVNGTSATMSSRIFEPMGGW